MGKIVERRAATLSGLLPGFGRDWRGKGCAHPRPRRPEFGRRPDLGAQPLRGGVPGRWECRSAVDDPVQVTTEPAQAIGRTPMAQDADASVHLEFPISSHGLDGNSRTEPAVVFNDRWYRSSGTVVAGVTWKCLTIAASLRFAASAVIVAGGAQLTLLALATGFGLTILTVLRLLDRFGLTGRGEV
ncbi:hypothetical protein [Methylobacterium currus]|uniref:hypothetical protein n=1 Tax=Methylobacterium currus TaxID=2051553 RepID=UPI000F504DE3|nr:hypothetical protein [Methylobacterium currus]